MENCNGTAAATTPTITPPSNAIAFNAQGVKPHEENPIVAVVDTLSSGHKEIEFQVKMWKPNGTLSSFPETDLLTHKKDIGIAMSGGAMRAAVSLASSTP